MDPAAYKEVNDQLKENNLNEGRMIGLNPRRSMNETLRTVITVFAISAVCFFTGFVFGIRQNRAELAELEAIKRRAADNQQRITQLNNTMGEYLQRDAITIQDTIDLVKALRAEMEAWYPDNGNSDAVYSNPDNGTDLQGGIQ